MTPDGHGPGGRRIGVFGGAFDPPHVAHRALAEAALRQLALDELRIIPTGQAWHKARALTDAVHRLAMCRLAFADLPRVRVDTREIDRAGPSYTVDTLTALRAEQPGAALFLVVGADQWLAFRTWHRWAEILRLATVAVANRPLEGGDGTLSDLDRVGLPHVVLAVPPLAVSATAVRERWWDPVAGPAARALVPPAVARYISEHRLYAPAAGPATPYPEHP
ncbi:MAG: nicotinate (nicotinamide) nucleotide adenylyltransferase [Tepidimonas taiwanensis]|nr:nicotinate (nicotinamide) nucleotide adenylyltransferase [Tepidimonas taiwanensis]MDM7462093.1 nicotinate (nicotinamide) nucleotide adenylyltransferase [Tepidimonas taiwanensis]